MKMSNETKPPRWPLKFLRFFLKKEYLEEIEGDMEELFHENAETLSLKKAKRIYTWEMLKLLRPVLIKNLEALHNLNQYDMFKNYFKISTRGLMKNPLNSFINIFGLSVAIGLCVFFYAFARWTYSTDQFHEHKNEVYLATSFVDREGTQQQYGTTPRPLGEMLKEDFPQIKSVCRIEDRNVVVKYEDNVFHERVRYVDPAFLEMFTFPLKWGTSGSLADVNSIILSEKMSTKYFGDQNPVGLDILVKFNKDSGKVFKITGVAREFPKARTIDFSFLINVENLRTSEPAYNFHDWHDLVNATLIQVENPNDISAIKGRMGKYKHLQNEAVKADQAISSFAFEPLATLHERTENMRDHISRSTRSDYITVIYFSVIGVFMLTLACLNYINIAIVSATKRLKEIGVRKSIGAKRGTVIVQFLSENMVITFFAVVVGLILGLTVFIPGFENMWHFSMGFRLNDMTLWIFLPAVLLFTSIASGIYPSLYISKFTVVGIFKGSVQFGRKNPLTKTFLGIQLVLSCIFLTSAVMFTQNSSYLAKRSWGYNQQQVLYAVVPDQFAYEELHALLIQEPDVLSISGSRDQLGKSNTGAVLQFPDREFEVDQFAVDANYFETMGIPILKGRVFKDHEGSDRQAIVANELLVKNMGWEHPIGQQFKIAGVQYEVVGVVKNFHHSDFYTPLHPTIFNIAGKTDYRYLSIKVRSGSEIKTYKTLQAKWAQLFPEVPFDGGFQEDVWGNYFQEIGNHGKVWITFAFIAVCLASLGLYGLITLNVAARIKEFSIRKVLGADVKNITSVITNQYVILFGVALIIGAPLSYLLVKLVFDSSFAYHMPVDFSGAVIAVAILILVLVFTISTQIKKVIKLNPVDGLKAD